MKTKILYAEDIRNNLYSGLINRDIKIDFRDIFLAMDRACNFFAKGAFFENWKSGYGKIDDLWIVDVSPLTVVDPVNGNSYLNLPVNNYVSLPNGQGFNDLYFVNDPTKVTKKYFNPVLIKNFKDVAGYRSSMAGNNQGRISCYLKNRVIYFDRGNINKVYGQVGTRFVLRDASMLQDSDVYPISAEYEDQFINKTIAFFMEKRMKEPDLIRDSNDTNPIHK